MNVQDFKKEFNAVIDFLKTDKNRESRILAVVLGNNLRRFPSSRAPSGT